MNPTKTHGATHLFEKPENWQDADGKCGDLEVRAVEVRASTFGPREIVELHSTWKPSRDEIAAIMVGGVIEIGIAATSQPPMRVGVVTPVDTSGEFAMADAAAAIAPEPVDEFVGKDIAEATLTINEEAHGHG